MEKPLPQEANSYVSLVKSQIREMQAYSLKPYSYSIKLNQNESPYDLPRALKEEIVSAFCSTSWNRYPSFGSDALVQKLAGHLHMPQSGILVGNGSNDMLQLVMSSVLVPGDRVLVVAPTFLIYSQIAHTLGAEVVEIGLADDWTFPIEALKQAVAAPGLKLSILCSPNSPTGSELAAPGLKEIVQASPGLVLLDEAYHEFTDGDSLALLRNAPNLLIARTLSKAMGLAGLRVGYVMADESLVHELSKAKLPYNLNSFSELVAVTLLDNFDLVRNRVEMIKAERDRLRASLTQFPTVRVFPTTANFLMIEVDSSSAVFKALRDLGVLVRDISSYHPRLANKLRVSVGTPEENNAFVDALKRAVSNYPK